MLNFRIECPKCKWGHPFHDSYVNQGWLKLECAHCENQFFTKIAVTGISVAIEQELPEGQPCHTLEKGATL